MTVHVLDLPAEVLFKIFSFLPAQRLLLDVSRVCRQFHELVCSRWYWRMRYVRELGSQPVARGDGGGGVWQLGCLQTEFVRRLQRTAPQVLRAGSVGGFDCVHIMHPELSGASAVIAAGSRDSNVYLWRRRPSPVGGAREGGQRRMREFTHTELLGHKGWVWSLASDPAHPHLCSGSWDATVKVWDVCVAKEVAHIRKAHKAAVLSMDVPQRGTLVSGSWDKHVRVFDLRIPVSVVSQHQEHNKPVLCLSASENYIYSGSEDRSLCVWDCRAQKLLQRLKYKSLVASMYLDHGVMSTASSGVVTLYDASQGTLQQQLSFSPGHTQPLTAVYHNLAMVVTSSKDGSVHIHSSGSQTRRLAAITHHTSAVTGVDFSRNTLALASSDRGVSLWTSAIH